RPFPDGVALVVQLVAPHRAVHLHLQHEVLQGHQCRDLRGPVAQHVRPLRAQLLLVHEKAEPLGPQGFLQRAADGDRCTAHVRPPFSSFYRPFQVFRAAARRSYGFLMFPFSSWMRSSTAKARSWRPGVGMNACARLVMSAPKRERRQGSSTANTSSRMRIGGKPVLSSRTRAAASFRASATDLFCPCD